MKRSTAKLRGVSGNTTVFPDPGGAVEQSPLATGPMHQSGHADANASTKLRIRLSREQAREWMLLPPKLRQRVTRVVFGSAMHGVDLAKLAAAESELRKTRLSIINLLQLALHKNASLDVPRANAVLNLINQLLGEKLEEKAP